MNIVISCQNFVSSDTLKEYINKKLNKLIKFNDKLIKANVHLNLKKGIHTTKINISGVSNTDIVAEGKDTSTIYKAFDNALDKVKSQIINK